MNKRRNKGLTLIGFLIVLVVGLYFAYSAMRVIPMYLEYHALVNAMGQLQSNPSAASMSPSQIKKSIKRSLWTSYASSNIQTEDVRVSKTTGGVKVRVAYEIRRPFIGNIDIVGKFDRSVVLRN